MIEHASHGPRDTTARETAAQRHGRLTMPPGALGAVSEAVLQLAGLQGRARPSADRVQITVFAADHGVTAAGVSAFPTAVTAEMVRNFADGGAAINVLARALDAELEVIDVGVAGDPAFPEVVQAESAGPGTADFRHEPAMTRDQFRQAWASGAAAAERAAAGHMDLFIGGDMGIGNTTSAAAVAAAILDAEPQDLTGPGSGIDDAGMARKVRAIAAGIARCRAEYARRPEEILQQIGGFEIVALAGAFTRAAALGLPVLVDGFIASAAALAAVRRQPETAPWLVFGHRSAEPGHDRILTALNARALLDLGMRLGEGTGAAMAVPVLRLGCRLHAEMATFEEAGVSDGG